MSFIINPYVFASATALTTLSFRSSATSGIATITGPADIEAGDLLFILDKAASKGAPPTTVVPSGFTSISNQALTDQRQIISYKIANGSEASASITGMDGTSNDNKIMAVFQGDIAISSVSVEDINEQVTDGNPTAQVVNASTLGTPPLIVVGCYGTDFNLSAVISPRGFSGATGNEISSADNRLYFVYAIMNSSPADVTIDMDDEGQRNTLQSFLIEAS